MEASFSTRRELLTRIEGLCRAEGLTEREFGYLAVQDGRFVERLRAGKGSLKVIERAEAFLAAPHIAARPSRRRSIQEQVAA